MKHLFVMLAIALLAAPVPVRAEPFPPPGLPTPETLERIRPALGLSSDQEARMSAVLAAAREQGAPAEATVRERHKALQQALRDPAATADAAGELLARVLEAEGAVKQHQLRTLFALRDILTPEQRGKAAQLAASKPVAEQGDLESRVRAKTTRLRAAVEALGEGPTEGMKRRGEPIQELIREGRWEAADKALDTLIADGGIDAADEPDVDPAFALEDAGDTSIDGLRARLEAVKERAREVVSIPTMRRLMKARDALEQAKAAEDATAAGRILTFAEKALAGR
jgi:Spy/CpxP family protein refolding chaperone